MLGWHFLPETFVKALKEGLISPVKNPVKTYDLAECQFCKEEGAIGNTTYQLCSKCRANLQYHGEKCFVCSGSANHWEQFVEQREAWLSKPKTFQNTTLQEVKQPVAYGRNCQMSKM